MSNIYERTFDKSPTIVVALQSAIKGVVAKVEGKRKKEFFKRRFFAPGFSDRDES